VLALKVVGRGVVEDLPDLTVFLDIDPAVGLVGERRVGEAIAEHDPAAGERGPHDFSQVLGARGFVEEDLGPGVHLVVQDRRADALGDRGAAGFARDDHAISAGLAQGARHGLDQGGLAGALGAFERDESPAHECLLCESARERVKAGRSKRLFERARIRRRWDVGFHARLDLGWGVLRIAFWISGRRLGRDHATGGTLVFAIPRLRRRHGHVVAVVGETRGAAESRVGGRAAVGSRR
jgi:hypothetical protein